MSELHIHEVTARDGLQNEAAVMSTPDKLQLIESLISAGYRDIEVTSFVKPSWIPQLADAVSVLEGLNNRQLAAQHSTNSDDRPLRFWSLVPNRRGMERALDAGVRHIATFMSASESHNRKNLNRTQFESLGNIRQVTGMAQDANISVRAYLSTVFGCPYEGFATQETIKRSVDLTKQLLDLGALQVALGDTTGMGDPALVEQVLSAMDSANIPMSSLAMHMHDTQGMALANIAAGYRLGIRCFDGSTGGLGGCPYAPGASGNVATEDMVNMFHRMGLETGVDLDKAVTAAAQLSSMLNKELSGRYHRFHQGQQARELRRTSRRQGAVTTTPRTVSGHTGAQQNAAS